MYDDILIPTDGSDVTMETLEHGLTIAADHDATVHALYIVDNRMVMAADRDRRASLRGDLENEGEQAISEIADRTDARSLSSKTAIRNGTPYREILEYAEEEGIDLITIGSHGKSPREKVQSLGSVSERVVDGAKVPVLVVKNVAESDR